MEYPTASNGKLGKFPLICLASYIALKPLYLFPSGYPQVADALVVLLLIYSLSRGLKIASNSRAIVNAVFAFSAYTVLVNIGWAVFLGDLKIALYATYYVYNAIVFALIIKYSETAKKSLGTAIVYGAGIALFIQIPMIYVGDGYAGSRAIGSFNNPNQLGYFALLMASIAALISRYQRVRLLTLGTVIALSLLLVLLSLSKAAIISIMVLIVIHLVNRPMATIAAGILAGTLVFVLGGDNIIDRATNRVENIGEQQDDSLAGRGYGRIVTHPEYIVIGAGEGGWYRFPEFHNEIHSTLGTVLFSYGLIGTALFAAIFVKLYRRTESAAFLYLVPSFLYGLVHQGLRFSPFWILVAIVFIFGRPALHTREAARGDEAKTSRVLRMSAKANTHRAS